MARTAKFLAAGAWFASLVAVTGMMGTGGAGCGGPNYPLCDNDEQCNAEGHKGVCVDHKCVECRDDAACGVGRHCDAHAGTCADIPGYCDENHACPAASTCTAHRCHEPPTAKAEKPFVDCDDTQPCGTAG